jgi:hypothetical protein
MGEVFDTLNPLSPAINEEAEGGEAEEECSGAL